MSRFKPGVGFSPPIALTPINNWRQESNALALSCFKDSFGAVHLKGRILGIDATANTVGFVLPEGYRPTKPLYIVVVNTDQLGELRIAINGEVTIYSAGGYKTWCSLDGVSFVLS